jgi:hypothetical protein
MKRSAIISLTLLLAALASASSSSAQTGEIRTVPLVALSSTGRVNLGLAIRNVRLKSHDATLRSFVLDTSPRRILLLLDTSGSMSEPIGDKRVTVWNYTKHMAEDFLKTVFRQDSVALDVFADKERQIVPFTHDFASIRAAIDGLPQPRGFTFAGNALQAALRDFGTTTGFGDSVVFFSDGQFPRDGGLFDSLMEDASKTFVRVFLIFPVTDFDRYYADPPLVLDMESLINSMRATGGFSFAPKEVPSDWATWEMIRSAPLQRVAALSNAIHGTYRVELQFTDAIRKKQKLQLEIVDDKGKNMRNVYALYPHTIYPAIDSRRP